MLLAPAAALLAASFAGEPLLAQWTQVFMGTTAQFIAQFFPLFLLGALFGKLMEDSGAVAAIANFLTGWLGPQRAVLAVVVAGALVTYGGVSLFVSYFVLVPMAVALFQAADIPRRLIPASVLLGSTTFTMSAMPGTPAIQNTIPMPFFGTTPFAAPGLGLIASAVMLAIGLAWLGWREKAARRAGEGFGTARAEGTVSEAKLRELGALSHEFDPAERDNSAPSTAPQPSILVAALPLLVMVGVNLLMSFAVLPRLDTAYLAEPRFGGVELSHVAGIWSVITALTAACATLLALRGRAIPSVRETLDAGANAAILPIFSVASLAGFGAVIASLPAFASVRDWVLTVEGGPLVSLAIATNLLAALTGSASGGLTIALDALGHTYMALAAQQGIAPALLHRVAAISAGTLDILPHNGAIVTLLAVSNCTHKESYGDIVMTGIVNAIVALVVVIALGELVGSF